MFSHFFLALKANGWWMCMQLNGKSVHQEHHIGSNLGWILCHTPRGQCVIYSYRKPGVASDTDTWRISENRAAGNRRFRVCIRLYLLSHSLGLILGGFIQSTLVLILMTFSYYSACAIVLPLIMIKNNPTQTNKHYTVLHCQVFFPMHACPSWHLYNRPAAKPCPVHYYKRTRRLEHSTSKYVL